MKLGKEKLKKTDLRYNTHERVVGSEHELITDIQLEAVSYIGDPMVTEAVTYICDPKAVNNFCDLNVTIEANKTSDKTNRSTLSYVQQVTKHNDDSTHTGTGGIEVRNNTTNEY